MKQSRFTEEQIIGVLREQESGIAVKDVNGGAKPGQCGGVKVGRQLRGSDARAAMRGAMA